MIISILMSCTFEAHSQKLYKTTWKHSGTIIGISGAMLGGSVLIEDQKGPFTIEDITLLDKEAIFGIDKSTVGNFSAKAATHSDYFKNGILAAPLTLFLSGQARQNAREIMMMYAEVFAINGGLTAITKSSFGRYRPYAYNSDVDPEYKLQSTTRRSFFSGHVSHVASLSFFTATVFDDLYPESDFRYVVWAGAITAPSVTAYLRVKAGRHFPTDVIVGYGVGALIGYLVPELHKITQKTDVTIIGADGGLGMIYSF